MSGGILRDCFNVAVGESIVIYLRKNPHRKVRHVKVTFVGQEIETVVAVFENLADVRAVEKSFGEEIGADRACRRIIDGKTVLGAYPAFPFRIEENLIDVSGRKARVAVGEMRNDLLSVVAVEAVGCPDPESSLLIRGERENMTAFKLDLARSKGDEIAVAVYHIYTSAISAYIVSVAEKRRRNNHVGTKTGTPYLRHILFFPVEKHNSLECAQKYAAAVEEHAACRIPPCGII